MCIKGDSESLNNFTIGICILFSPSLTSYYYEPFYGYMYVPQTLREMCQQYGNRVTGENGVAKYIIQLNTAFEFWENKLVGILHANQGLPQR